MTLANSERSRLHCCSTRGVLISLGMVILFSITATTLVAQSQSELKVKAAYVFNITKYVEFATPRDHLVLGVIGDGPIASALRSELQGRVSDSRPITVIMSPTDDELRKCDLVYVAVSSSKRLQAILQKTSTYKLLTVGDASSFAEQGGIVGLVTVGERIEIQINLDASRKADVRFSSRLLKLATVMGSPTERGR